MKKLSVIIITYNEQRNIGRALDSIRDLSDDIVVVDSNSTDRTSEICKKHNTRFIVRDWEGYSITKNYGNSLAKHDWILSIDADEAISEELYKSIKESFSGNPSENQIYSFNRLTNYCGKWIRHSGWYPDRKIRIWNRNFGQWEGEIHESIKFNGEVKNTFLKGDLHHYSYYTIQEHIRQVNRYTSLSAEKLYHKGKKAGYFKLTFSPVFKFLRDYFLSRGFLDGKEGYAICRISAHAVFIKYIKLIQLNRSHPNNGNKENSTFEG